MTEERGPDPLEGFHLDDFDQETKTLSLRIHEYILKHPAQRDALIKKVEQILSYDDNIDKVVISPRD